MGLCSCCWGGAIRYNTSCKLILFKTRIRSPSETANKSLNSQRTKLLVRPKSESCLIGTSARHLSEGQVHEICEFLSLPGASLNKARTHFWAELSRTFGGHLDEVEQRQKCRRKIIK